MPASAPDADAAATNDEGVAATPTPADTDAPAATEDPAPRATPSEAETTPGAEGADGGVAPAETSAAAEGETPATTKAGGKKKAKPRRERRPPRPQRTPLTLEQRTEARESARQVILRAASRDEAQVRAALDMLETSKHIVYIARFRRDTTGGMDERTLRSLRNRWEEALVEEERRIELAEILRTHGALDEKTQHRLARATTIPAMEDVAAPHLPVVAGRATLARGLGLEPLADAIRKPEEGVVLSELAKTFVKEDEEPKSLDAALAGARDILAEEMSLNADLRARLRKQFRRDAKLTVGLRTERKGDAGRHKSLVGYTAPVGKVQPLKFLAIRRAEKDRILVTTIEPPEGSILPLLHKSAAAEEHPHAGFLRAAIEDGYRRILKPLFQAEIRNELKQRADAAAMETFERNLRHRLLGPVGGKRRVLGLRPDVMQGHRWCTIDPEGLPTGSGTLPHEGTAGREACVTELAEVLKTYEADAIAVGSGGGRAEALSLAQEAVAGLGQDIDITVVTDGGTHTLEAQGKLEVADRPEVPAECRGAYSLARRFQDPLAELVAIDPKALALGPHLHEVHQGRLRQLLDETVASCVSHVGVDPNHASVDLLGRVPGFDRASATAFGLWRSEHGALLHKAALAAVPGIGTNLAEQAVGFLQLRDAADPRDRTQLHPEQYGIVDTMAEKAGCDVPALFADHTMRQKVRLAELEADGVPMPVLKYVLYQITAGHLDDRPRFAKPITPPEGLTLDTLQPGLILEGRVIRAMPFGLFVDVGMGTDALIPTPHIGDHPGIEPATVAPIGAVIQARVLEVLPEKRRLTLSMRRERFDPRGRGGPRGPRQGGARGGPRDDRRGGRDAQGARGRAGGGGGDRRGATGGDRRGGGADARGGPRRKSSPRKGGKYGGGGGVGDIFSRRGAQHERGVPRSISLGPDDSKKASDAKDEAALTPEQLLAKKLADLQKKLGGEE